MLDAIPLERPNTPLLDSIDEPADLRELNVNQLETLAHELREFLLFSVGKTGGHFGAGLGVVELTFALHYVFDTPNDTLVWDAGHPAIDNHRHGIANEQKVTMRVKRMRHWRAISG